MMDIVAPVGVFQVWDAVPVVGRRWFRLLCDTTGFMLLRGILEEAVVLVELGVVEQRHRAVLERSSPCWPDTLVVRPGFRWCDGSGPPIRLVIGSRVRS